jgi:hypothetical protein
MTTAKLISEWPEQNGALGNGRIMHRASFSLHFCSEIFVVARDSSAYVAPDNCIARHVLQTSQAGLSNADGGSRGVGVLRLFPRFGAGQDALRENSNLFKSISVVIPIAIADVLRPIQGQSHFVRLFLLRVARHAINLAKEFEHDVHRISAPRTQIEIGAGSRE